MEEICNIGPEILIDECLNHMVIGNWEGDGAPSLFPSFTVVLKRHIWSHEGSARLDCLRAFDRSSLVRDGCRLTPRIQVPCGFLSAVSPSVHEFDLLEARR